MALALVSGESQWADDESARACDRPVVDVLPEHPPGL